MPQGVTSASLIIVILVAAAVGAVTGGLLDQAGVDRTLLAIAAGFAATIVAGIVRHVMIRRLWGAGPDVTAAGVFGDVLAIAQSLGSPPGLVLPHAVDVRAEAIA